VSSPRPSSTARSGASLRSSPLIARVKAVLQPNELSKGFFKAQVSNHSLLLCHVSDTEPKSRVRRPIAQGAGQPTMASHTDLLESMYNALGSCGRTGVRVVATPPSDAFGGGMNMVSCINNGLV
jgi:hypothetical protein